MKRKMLRATILAGCVAVAACERPPAAAGGTEPPKTPLGQVEKILKVEPAPADPVAVDPPPVDPVKPAVPVAKPVPDKPGFVISPHNGKWIDVTGIAPGELMLDPHFPAEEKKYFRVPEAPKPAEPPVETVSPPDAAG